MHDFKGFDFVYSKHFFLSTIRRTKNRAGRRLSANRPRRRSRISEFAPGPAGFLVPAHFLGRRATQGRFRRSGSVGRLGNSVPQQGRSRMMTTVVNSDRPTHPLQLRPCVLRRPIRLLAKVWSKDHGSNRQKKQCIRMVAEDGATGPVFNTQPKCHKYCVEDQAHV